jgi:hypothetical protein
MFAVGCQSIPIGGIVKTESHHEAVVGEWLVVMGEA